MNKPRIKYSASGIDLKKHLKEFELYWIQYALSVNYNNVNKAAKYLGIEPHLIYIRLQQALKTDNARGLYWSTADKLSYIKSLTRGV